MNLLQQIEKEQSDALAAARAVPDFGPGDTLKVNVKVIEGGRERVQAYEGVCIARSNRGVNSSFTVRKISYGEGVERIFPLYSPRQALLPARPYRQGGPHHREARLPGRCRQGVTGSGTSAPGTA
jgi:ribosomal protein L19